MNRPTLWATAAVTTLSVPRTLDLTPSQGCRSSIGRCLRAAAWKITSGRMSPTIWSMRRASRMSATTRSSESSNPSPVSSSWRRWRFDSSWSSMTRRSGPKPFTWRHSSLPIEPPAPVTRTRAPRIVASTSGETTCISGRPMRAPISSERRSVPTTSRCIMDTNDGRWRTLAPTRDAVVAKVRTWAEGSPGMARSTTSTRCTVTTASRSDSIPSTGRRRTTRLFVSSSRKPMGARPKSGTFSRSRARARPASPAPTIRVLSPFCKVGMKPRSAGVHSYCSEVLTVFLPTRPAQRRPGPPRRH